VVDGYEHKCVCGVANIHRIEIGCIGSRGTAREFLSVSQVIFTPIVVFIEKIGPPHPTSISNVSPSLHNGGQVSSFLASYSSYLDNGNMHSVLLLRNDGQE
jgi:hypothetical protein